MNYYEILNIPHNADDAQIKRAYFAAIKKHSPEHSPEEFKTVKKAYETLSSKFLREEYDNVLFLPSYLHKVFLHAIEMEKSGNFEIAIDVIERLVIAESDITALKVKLGDLYILNHNTGKAIKLFEKLVSKDEKNALYKAKLATAYHERGWNVKADKEFKSAMMLGENEFEVVNLYVEYLFDRGNSEGAMDLSAVGKALDKALLLCTEQGCDPLNILIKKLMISVSSRNSEALEQTIEMFKCNVDKSSKMYKKALERLLHDVDSAIFQDLSSIAKNIVRCGVKIFPENHEFQELAIELKIDDDMDEILSFIESDEKIPVILYDLLAAVVFPNYMDEEEKFIVDTTVFHEINIHKKSIIYLKQQYPKAYALRATFFEDLLNPKKHSKLEEKFYKEYKRKYADKFFGDSDDDSEEDTEVNTPFVREQPKVGRNEPCPCNSGKKYKKCCG